MAEESPPYWRWRVWVGNTEAQTFRLRDATGTPLDLTGARLRGRIGWLGGSMDIGDGQPGLVIEEQSGETLGQWTLALTLAQQRKLPAASSAAYEIEMVIDGEEKTLLQGPVVCSGGLNADG